MKVLLTRTNLDSKHLAKKLNDFGVTSVISPVIKIVSIPVEVPNKSDFQSVIITSKNTLETVKKLYFSQKVPIFCVGDITAQLFENSGFSNVKSASGTSEDLLELFVKSCNPEKGPVLYLAGQDTHGAIERDLKHYGFIIEKKIAYRAEAVSRLTQDAEQALRSGEITGIFIFSPRSAIILNELISTFKLHKAIKKTTAFCLSDAVAKEASATAWSNILISERPTQESILELLRKNLKSL